MFKSLTSRLPWGRKNTSRVEALVLDMLNTSTRSRTYAQIVNEAYKRNSVVARSIRLIASNAASVKPLLYQRGENDKEVRDHPLLTLLRRPNKHMARRRFVETILIHKMLAGKAFILKLPTGPGRPLELHLLRPDLVEVKGDGRLGGERTFIYRPSAGERFVYTEDDVLYLSSIDPLDQNGGASDLESVLGDIDASNLAGAWNVSLLRNGGKPSALIISKQTLTDEQLTLLRQAKQDQYGGHANAGKIAVIEGGDIEYRELGMKATDMDWLKGRKHAEAMIAVGIGVAPELVGLSEHKTFSNYEQAQKALWTETIIPELDYIYTELDNWLTPRYADNLYLAPFLDEISVLQDDKGKEAERINTLAQANVLTFGQAGDELGFEVRPDMRERYTWELQFAQRFGVYPPSPDDPGSAVTTQGKRFNLRTDEQKTMLWKRIDGEREAFNKAVAERVRARFDEERQAVIKAIESTSPSTAATAAEAAVDAGRGAWSELLAATILSTMEAFGESTRADIKAQAPSLQTKQAETVFGIYFGEALEHAQRVAAEHVVKIEDTTRTTIRSHITTAIEEGDSIPAVAKRIDKLYLESIIPNRSELIARTEVHSSSEAGSWFAAKGTELELEKVWITTRDGRQRTDHNTADNQRVGLDEKFLVGGSRLAYPGDPDASADQVIQCRCTHAYEVPGSSN